MPALGAELSRWVSASELGPMQSATLIVGGAPDRAALEDCLRMARQGGDMRSRELADILASVLARTEAQG